MAPAPRLLADGQNEPVAFDDPPPVACWQHTGLRSGFEVAYFIRESRGHRIEGTTTAWQDGGGWIVTYVLELDHAWKTRRARITSRAGLEAAEKTVESDGEGHWLVDGKSAADLDGCLDADLEASAMTNTLPVRRLSLAEGQNAAAPAAYVPMGNRNIERLDQVYTRREDQHGHAVYDYEAPAFDFRCQLVYETDGLVLDYPGIARRAA